MVGWHHQLNGHGFGWTPGVGDGQGGLTCCGSRGRKELDTTERLNWSCSQHQSSCCVSLCALFIEPRVDKGQAVKLEENSRGRRNCRCVYSLLAGAAVEAADSKTYHNTTSLLADAAAMAVDTLYALSWLTQRTQP